MTFRSKVLLAQAPLGLALATLGIISAWTIRTLGEHRPSSFATTTAACSPPSA